MSTARDFHDKAMSFMDQALAEKRAGRKDEAEQFLRQAFELERQAAETVEAGANSEPSRSILYRSAATLALRCGMADVAEDLAHAGMAGDPPNSVRAELESVVASARVNHDPVRDANYRDRILDFLHESGWSINHTISVHPREAQLFEIEQLNLHASTCKYIKSRFARGIYQHQLLALQYFAEGESICVATGTSSGKSMIFYSAAIEFLCRNPKGTMLLVYPMKALAREQENRINEALSDAGIAVTTARIDGQVPVASRAALLRRSQVLIVTPDIIHSWLLTSVAEPAVRNFLKRIGLVIVDELHSYTGVFGSNSAFLFRRLQHMVSLLGGVFSYIGASATIANPDLHLRNLFGARFRLIGPEADTSPRNSLEILLTTPPKFDDLLSELTYLFKHLASQKDHRFIAFVDSRKQVEYLSAIMRRSDDREEGEPVRLDHLQSMHVLPFRAGLELEDLNTIQGRISDGTVRGVISTSALELGMDIPFLDTGVLAGVPMSRTSLLQRIGRIGRHKPGVVIIVNRGLVQDIQAFQQAEHLMDRPLTESSLYLENRRIQYLHALCVARHGGEHDSALGGGSATESEFASDVNWPPGFLELCQKERIGEIAQDLQSMKIEAGESPNHVFPLRDVESQFQVEMKEGPTLRQLGNLGHAQLMREAYPGAIYYYTGLPFRVHRVLEQTKKIHTRRESHFTTKPTALPTMVFPNLSEGNVERALRLGELTAIDCSVQIREVIVGFKERRGPNEFSVSYPLSLIEGGIRFDLPRFTRNYFTTGVILTHSVLSAPGVRTDLCAELLYEAFLSLLPFERQDVGSATDTHRSEREFVNRGQTFIAIYDQTYGSLRLSSRLLDGDLLPRVLKRARDLADASDLSKNEPLTAKALDELTSRGTEELRDLNVGSTSSSVGASGDTIQVIMPESRGLDVSHDNHLFTVTSIFFSPKLQSVAYRGRRETTPIDEDVVDIIAVGCLVPIPGESRLGAYDPETGDLREIGKA